MDRESCREILRELSIDLDGRKSLMDLKLLIAEYGNKYFFIGTHEDFKDAMNRCKYIYI